MGVSRPGEPSLLRWHGLPPRPPCKKNTQDRTAGGLRACLALGIDRFAEGKARAGAMLEGALSLAKKCLGYYLIGKITTIITHFLNARHYIEH